MMKITCPIASPGIKSLAAEIIKDYPEATRRANFDDKMCAMWVGYYNSTNDKSIDFIPSAKELVKSVEKKRNQDGKSFLYVPEKVSYIKSGKEYEYTVIDNHIFTPNGQEVYAADASNAGEDRNKILSKLKVQQGNALVVTYKDSQYIVDRDNNIMSVKTGKMMQWGEENGDRKAILNIAQDFLRKKRIQQQSSSRSVTVTDVYNRLKQQYTSDSPESKLLELVYNALNNSNIKIVERDLGEDVSGRFVASEKTIFYNPNALQVNTLLHELIHAATTYYLRSENTEDFPQEVKIAIEEIKECYNLLKQDFIETHFYENGKLKEGIDIEKAFSFWIQGNDTYGYTSPSEMVAELGKESFVEHIKDFDRRHKGKNIFQRLIDSIAKLFGINKTYGSLEGTLKKALTTILTTPNKELMDRYSKESATIKDNIKNLKESVHVIIVNHKAANDLLQSLPENSDVDYVDSILKIDENAFLDSIQISEGGKVNRFRDLHKDTILIYNNHLFLSLNGTATIENGVVNVPVRVYAAKGLSLNEFKLQKDSNGVDYIAEIKPLYKKASQVTQQQNLPGPETKMDIWAGSNPQNADLSNIAQRPFKLQLFKGEEPIQFNSVEQAFQYTKFRLLSQFLGFEETKPFLLSDQKLTGEDYKDNVKTWVRRGVKAATIKNGTGISNIGDSYEEELSYIQNHIEKLLKAKDGWEAKRLGGKNGGYTISGHSGSTFLDTIWSSGELVAEDVMKAAMKASFEQNPQALQRLLATGNATLTHTRGGEWAKAMPELLMEVRDELRGQQSTQQQFQKEQANLDNSNNNDTFVSTINITQNAGGRLGTLDENDFSNYNQAKQILVNPESTQQQIKQAEETLEEIYQRKEKEIQNLFKEITSLTGVSISIERAAGAWEGEGEYSFAVRVEANSQKDYDRAIQAVSYVAEAARQDAFIENQGEVDSSEVSSQSLLRGEHTPHVHILFTKAPSQQEIAQIESLFTKNSGQESLIADLEKSIKEKYKDSYISVTTKKESYNDKPQIVVQRHHAGMSFNVSYRINEEGKLETSTANEFETTDWEVVQTNGSPMDVAVQEYYDMLQIPTDVTITKEGLTFVMPAWMLKEGATFEDYKKLYNNWFNKIKIITENGRKGRFESLVGKSAEGRYEKSRFHSANERPEGSNISERSYSNFRDNYLSERRISKESGSLLSEEEGRRIKESAERILNSSKNNSTASPGTTTTPAMEKTLNSLRNYYRWKKNHVEFKIDTHEYLLDGVPVDYSVTQYGEKIFGKPNIQGDYSHSTAMGNDVDELTRDFFAGKDVEGNTYKNLNEARKQQVISDLKRFQKYLDGRFKSGYRVITTPLELVAKMADNGKEVTVAGTPDMLVIDSKGDVYMVDMKVKNHPITQTYNGKEVDDRRNYTFQQNGYRQIIEAIFPELRGRIKELNLLWFDTSYPRQGREAKFETSKTGVVTVTDSEEGQVLLSEYSKWATPSLKENVEESVIPLENNKDVLPGVQPLDSYSDTVETPQSSSPSGAAINPEIQRPHIKSDAYDSALQTQDNRVIRFYRTFSPQQIKDRGAYIANLFSDIIDTHYFEKLDALDDIINDPNRSDDEKNAARAEKVKVLDPVNGRQYIAGEVVGIPQIIEEIKETLQSWMEDDIENNNGERAVLFQNTLDYFEDLFNTQASLDIEESEGIRIIGYTTKNQTAEDEDAEERENGDDETGHVVSGSDGWNFQVRFENPFESMSKKVRGMFYDIERPETEKDDLGMTRHYSVGQIYASILSYFAKNVQSADDYMKIVKDINEIPEGSIAASIVEGMTQKEVDEMYPDGFPVFYVFEKMQSVYPWADQVIVRLTNDFMSPDYNISAKYPSTRGAMASQLYTNFKKAFIPYGKIKLNEDGIIPLNHQMEDQMQYDKLVANYNNRILLTDRSVYDAQGRIVKENANYVADIIDKLKEEFEEEAYWDPVMLAEVLENNPEQYNEFLEKTRYVLQSFGISATTDNVASYMGMSKDEEHPENMDNHVLINIFNDLLDIVEALNKVEDDRVATYNYILDTIDSHNRHLWGHFFDGRGMITDASYLQSFYDSSSKKTKYSYSADNYLMQRFRGLAMGSMEDRRKYIGDHYGKYDWFRNQKTGEWRNKWLEFWYNLSDENVNELPYQNIDVVVEPKTNGKDKVRKYVDWEKSDIYQVMTRSYAVDDWKKRDFTAMYLAPIFSDSPMSMTVRGPILNDAQLFGGEDEAGNWKSGAFQELVKQEMSRIKLVQNRKAGIENKTLQPIANFDGKRGLQFCFMPELNDYVFEDGKKFLDKIMEMKDDQRYTAKDIDEKISEAVRNILNGKFEEFARLTDPTKEGVDFNPTKEEANRYYNMVYANTAIIQITTVDLAFYNNATDFQKRFKETYAGGTQLNTNSRYGMKTENVILIADDHITSPSYKRIAAIIDNNKILSKDSKNDIKDMFKDINVADAQAIRGMYSFRAVFDMLGKWDDNMEATLERFKNNTWTREDFETLYQTIKPFAYSVIERNAGDGTRILVPQQHKNSEICALMMYDIISNGLGESPVYRALSRLMDEKDGIKGADGKPLIHMAQYESAGKVGNQGVINISILPNTVISVLDEGKYNLLPAIDKKGKPLPNDLDHAFENYYGEDGIKAQLDRRLDNGNITQKEYNDIIKEFRPTEDDIIDMIRQKAITKDAGGNNVINEEFVHVMPFENYYEQQKTPAHHIDAEAVFGSQARNIAPADLPSDFEMTVDSVAGEHTIKGGEETVDFLYELLNENLIEDFFGKEGLKEIFKSKESLKKAVEDIVRGNPKYGHDFADALGINKDTGNFNLSPNSPTVFVKMQEIITSFFKNRITKQKINGAALIQAAGIGLDEDLRVLYDDNGKLLGAECYMPITSRKLFEPLLEEVEIDGKKQLVLRPERLKELGLDKAVGYRIPTENKSSMMPLIIKGFTPLQNGSAIVLPAEITTMAGSDFDVDKMFIMLTSFTVQNYNLEKAKEDYRKLGGEFGAALERLEWDDLSEEEFFGGDQSLNAFKAWFEEHKDDYELDKPIVRVIKYDFNMTPKQNGRKARNNMIIQMFYNILTSKSGSESLFNPQGFPDVERAAKIVRIAKDPKLLDILVDNLAKNDPTVVPPVSEIRKQFAEDARRRFPDEAEAAIQRLNRLDDDAVIDIYIKTVNPEIPSDKVADALIHESKDNLSEFVKKYGDVESPIYPQTFINSHARNMAGVKQIGIYAVQASMAAKYQRATVTINKKYRFSLNGTETHYIFQSNSGRTLKNDGQMVGASADNGKNPNLTDMGSTKDTATIIGLGLNMGLSHLDTALLVGQPYMKEAGYKSERFKWNGANLLYMKPAEITTKKLLLNIIDPSKVTLEEKNYIRSMCYKLLKLNEAMEFVTKVSRADSPNGAMGNSYAKARVQRYKVDLLQGKMAQKTVFPIEKINETLSNDAVTVSAGENKVREQLKTQKMGLLHGMYALGINSFDSLMEPYFFGARKSFDDMVVKPLLYNQPDTKSDDDLYELVDNIYTSYIIYTLSGSSLFGNETNSDGSIKTMKQKREEYLNDFPEEFRRLLSENDKIRNLLGSILEVVPDGNRSKIALKGVGSMSKETRAEVEMRFNSLLYDEDPKAQKLAKDLFMYSYYRNGLQFTHDSFAHLFTTTFLLNFPVYNQSLESLDRDLSETDDKEFVENFTAQFLVTFPNAAFDATKILNNSKVEEGDVAVNDDVLIINLNNQFLAAEMRNDALSTDKKIPYPFIRYNDDLYILDRDKYNDTPGRPEYHKVKRYATFSKAPLFSSQMSVAELADEFPVSDGTPMFDYPDIDDGYYPGAPREYQTSDSYPYDNNNTGAPMDDSADIPAGDFWGDADIDGVDAADVYRRGGEQMLETQFCKE